MSTALHQRVIAFEGPYQDLVRQVWAGTPWMANVDTGRCGEERDFDIRRWCHEQFGPEAWPIHDKPGRWQRGGATVHGQTWFGFSTEEEMKTFVARWGSIE